MANHPYEVKFVAILMFLFVSRVRNAISKTDSADAAVLLELKNSVVFPAGFWKEEDPCEWIGIGCSSDGRVIRIQISRRSSGGKLPANLGDLSQLQHLELQNNNISGDIPSLRGLSSLQVLIIGYNNFKSIPVDFFDGMASLVSVSMDYNPLDQWKIPIGLQNSSSLQNFSAMASGIAGSLPSFFNSDVFPSLVNLHLSFNHMEGGLPSSLSGSSLQSIWLNGQKSNGRFTGSIDVLQNMSSLREAWLHSNSFTGPLPDFSSLQNLQTLSLRDNFFTGPVPSSLMNLPSLKTVNLTNNLLQGPLPVFPKGVNVDMSNRTNRFCLDEPGDCDPRVTTMISLAKSMNYPQKLAESWEGNSPCDGRWLGVACIGGNITSISFQKMGLTGTISPSFGSLLSLQQLILSDNNLTGTIPEELADLPNIRRIDLSNNNLYGKLPDFRSNVIINTSGNKNIGKDIDSVTGNSSNSPTNGSRSGGRTGGGRSPSRGAVIAASMSGGVLLVSIIGLAAFCLLNRKGKRLRQALHPHCSGSDNESLKINPDVFGVNTEGTGEVQMAETGSMVISIQVLRRVTDDFDSGNVLGRGGFGTVYKGELHDGTKIAVKRMEAGVMAGKGLSEFQSEIAVLTKVRHRNLVSLLGYCLDGVEKLLVYEYMPQGTLSRHLFNWAEEGLRPLEWTRRLTIALDVARGVEYLHSLAHQSFIHRDLKPSNILLGDDMRAKVSDFGLVRLAPEGKASVETRIAGTFGYLAPEYAVTGRVTTKADVYSFGVILMELITGRRALDEKQPEDSMHLVTWFRRMHINTDMFHKAMDPSLDISEETLATVCTVAELAGHCCTREPYQRPDMGHAVNVLSSLVELWKPSDQSYDDLYAIDFEMSLPQAVKRWQELEGTSTISTTTTTDGIPMNSENTRTSIPSRPHGFADSFMSEDGR